ncbi:hypothetical protein DIE04_04055 [Burkholderia sp. Bp8994]|nr:hypothetical protein DIE04_04055 [Burkholderia sp. Bp8994]RQS06613.1 hypothetical protein DIE02_14060 [Burkholderia sp. Bp8991]RQS33322.1 hypothetical protein DIE05_03810 [Burkholderia sp. Bp8995]RQS41516.1 hypothetical protein DIE01_11135 [Burkholderia sp. Bp8990]RQS50467.1 hypothetical protein DIE00_05320 [Burkholderia sp. Bp8989]RQS62781.1 hypothetical protein DID98_06390 [Burkholderia sp. Bp8984]RQZ40887.1 hypothetical protein DIE16_07120 [Burkholderia sp. Bp9090]
MVLYRPCCIRRSAASALVRAEPGKLRGFAGSPSGCPASRSFQGHSMTVDSYAYCPAAGAVKGVFTPTPIEIERSGAAGAGVRQEACR